MTLNCVYESFGNLFNLSVLQSVWKIQPRATIIDCILCSVRGPQESISGSLGIRGDHFKSLRAFRRGRQSSAEVTAPSSLSQSHRKGVGGGQRAGESWHFIKVAHLTDPILASLGPPFLPHLRHPLPLVLLSLFPGLSARTAHKTRPSVSNQVAFSQDKGSIRHSLQHQSVNQHSKEIEGLCIYRTFTQNFPSSQVHFNFPNAE